MGEGRRGGREEEMRKSRPQVSPTGFFVGGGGGGEIATVRPRLNCLARRSKREENIVLGKGVFGVGRGSVSSIPFATAYCIVYARDMGKERNGENEFGDSLLHTPFTFVQHQAPTVL